MQFSSRAVSDQHHSTSYPQPAAHAQVERDYELVQIVEAEHHKG